MDESENTQTDSLFARFGALDQPQVYTPDECERMESLVAEIHELKRSEDAIILAHSYQTPDIVYGVADFIGDSYGLSQIAAEHSAKKIIFCSSGK